MLYREVQYLVDESDWIKQGAEVDLSELGVTDGE
jgi:hypothetical protein